MRHRPLTALAHETLAELLRPGDLAVDASVGNGHDTLFLARAVAPDGQVYGFDIQADAIDTTRRRLAEAGLADRVTLCLQGHENLRAVLPTVWHGRVAAITFNLGYLPGGDKTLVTRAQTTLAALDQSLAVLRPGGVISLLVYRGHAGGAAEGDAVAAWVGRLGSDTSLSTFDSPGPRLYLVRRARR